MCVCECECVCVSVWVGVGPGFVSSMPLIGLWSMFEAFPGNKYLFISN